MNQQQKQVRSKSVPDKSSAMIDLKYGKVPPHAKDLEEAVLGSIMLQPGAFDQVAERLTPDCFYAEANQKIFRAMMGLQAVGQSMDILSVVHELKRMGELENVGGPYYVSTLTNAVVSSASNEAHCLIIIQKFIQRELIRIGGAIIQQAYDETADAFELLDQAEEDILAIGKAHLKGDMVGMDSVLIQAMNQIEHWRTLETHITGVPSGFKQLDRATRGWQGGDLIILAARPSVGKTAMALKLIRNAAFNLTTPVPVAVWSLEMKSMRLALRMLAAESETILHKIQTGRLDENEMAHLYRAGVQKLSKGKIFFDDEPGLNLMRFRAKARRMKKKHNIGLIIIDYLQLMSGDENERNREREIAKISRGLKKLAMELGIPVIALSQMSRAIESRTGKNKVPQLSDLRESGAIEQDADVVLFLWGPEDDEIEQDASLLTRRYFRIAKQRDGMLITVELDFRNEIQEWTELLPVLPAPVVPSGYRPIGDYQGDQPFGRGTS